MNTARSKKRDHSFDPPVLRVPGQIFRSSTGIPHVPIRRDATSCFIR
jgi:hypothetical protein